MLIKNKIDITRLSLATVKLYTISVKTRISISYS